MTGSQTVQALLEAEEDIVLETSFALSGVPDTGRRNGFECKSLSENSIEARKLPAAFCGLFLLFGGRTKGHAGHVKSNRIMLILTQ